ncbi:MAG TPA: IS110 family transposase, partial [Gemmataceae bacterium]|nr:IS110 family transposase [Gemmataceae bacterium]
KKTLWVFRGSGREAEKQETAMSHDIILAVDYHDENTVIRQFDERTGVETTCTVPTTAATLTEVVQQARRQRARGGRVVWIQESTTGWARVQALLGTQTQFLLANVVQMPRLPKGHRRKTDRTDTARILREYRNGSLPQAHQPSAWWRQVRRLVGLRENLVNRRTALRNWIDRYLAHETWESRAGLWSAKGLRQLRQLLERLPAWDRVVFEARLTELERLAEPLTQIEAQLHAVYRQWPEAQRLDAVRGIGVIAAVAIAARIGPIERFADADALIAFAGLAPGVRQSDQTRRDGRIGGGGTDGHLRHYLIEATIWARELPRYQTTYQRVAQRRGAKIGRLVVARLLLRSIYKVLRDGVAFTGERPRPTAVPQRRGVPE